ncbi:MAG: glycoside hydrolase family 88/105 protein [Bacteroidota bacterium]
METQSDLPFVNVQETIGTKPAREHTVKMLELMAGYIMQNTSYQFIDQKTGKSYDDSFYILLSPEVKMKSLFNDWKYWNGVIHMAFCELEEVLDDKKYRTYVQENYRFFFKNLDFLESQFKEGKGSPSGHQFFRLDRLDDFGAMAAGMIDIIKDDPKKEYEAYLDKVMNYIMQKQDRLKDGTFCRNRFGYTSLWGDDLYMSVPFLIRAWRYTGEEKYLQDAIDQVFNFKKYLFREDTGLYYHYRIMQENVPGVAHWGRANGWMVMAQCQLLDALPENHPERNKLISSLKEHLTGLARYQAANGMWRQLTDKTDSWHEASSTAMFTYGFAKAINKGWISDIYTSVAISGWQGLTKECIKANGYLDKVSTGFNFKQDLPYYYNIPIEPGGDHGIGAAIYAGIEILKLKNMHRDCVWC